MYILCRSGIGPAWALPKHDFDAKWGQSSLHAKQDYGNDKYANDGDYQKKDYEKWPGGKDSWGDHGP